MKKITWLGEDEDDVAGPSFTTCFDRKFKKGEAVDIDDEDTIARARKNPFFHVDGDDQAAGDDGLDDLTVAELRERAEAAGIDHAGLKKSEIRDALRAGNEQDAG